MPSTTGLQSYVHYEMARKVTLCVVLSLLAAQVEHASASTPSLASSVTVTTTYSAVSPSAISPTQTSLLSSSTARPDLPQNVSFQISIQLSQTAWSEDLLDRNSSRFVDLATNLTTEVSDVLKNVGAASVDVVEFKSGSVIAVLKVTASSSNEKPMKTQLANEMSDGKLGGFTVDTTLYSGAVFDVIFKLKFACNNSAAYKGFNQKGDFNNAINTVMSSHPKFIAANIYLIECLEADNITMVTVRVQMNDLSAANPNKELSSLKTAVDVGQVGNFSVVPEWKSYIPGEKLFHVLASLETESNDMMQTRKEVETVIEDTFKAEGNFRYGNVNIPDNTTVVIDIGMSSATSELPSLALSSLGDALRKATLGTVKVIKRTIRVTIDPKSITRKLFAVYFVQFVPSCKAADVADMDSLHYKNLSMGIWQFIDGTIKANKNLNQLYLETKVVQMTCRNVTTVYGISDVYMKPNAEDKIGQFGTLHKCKNPGIYDWGLKVLLKTPTLPETKGSWLILLGVYNHLVCFKPKPPTPPPTSSSTSTGNPATTGFPKNATETPPQNTTKQTATSAGTSKPPTTKATLPTPNSKPDLYVKLKLGMTWGEFCSKQETLKEKIARNVHDKSGTKVSSDRINYVNVERNCADSSKKNEIAEVWFYVSKSGSKEVHKCLTLKAYRVFKMFFENGNTKELGPDFEEKVVQVELAGNHASKYKNNGDGKMSSQTIILIAVAGAVGLFLMLLACCCLFCCGRRRRRRSRKYDSEHPAHALHVIHVDNGDLNPARNKDKQNRGKNTKKDNNKKGEKEGEGGNVKGDNNKGGHDNDGYENVNDNENNKNNNNKNIVDGKNNSSGQDDNSANGKPAGPLSEGQGNDYGVLQNTDGVGDHTYASINKPGSVKDGSGDRSSNAANVPVVVSAVGSRSRGVGAVSKNKGDGSNVPGEVPPVSPVTAVGNASHGVGADSSNKGNGSPGFNSSGAGNGRENQKRGSLSTPVSFRKADADPKNQDRRGSYVNMSTDDDVPLTHKTGTVGIVALAIRNKNGQKKETEFKNLNKDVPNEEVKYPPVTANKNRFPDVLPAPKSRVTLSTQPDYINANWIRDHKGQRCYIATQHPLQETMEDFWRMVWDQQTNTVVMVNDEEKEKPAEFMDYLPKGEGNWKRFGSVDLTIKQITVKADYVLTVLSIVESKNTASPREVSHFRFTSWKERAVPNVALFVGFVTATRDARKKYGDTKAPTIVHCSDGLGFTGVYIALDIGIKSHEESKTSVVDVFELSKNLRRDRHGIVGSLEHFNFIYQALYEYTMNYDKSDK